jgi:mono/diheme cytochrome c family protein
MGQDKTDPNKALFEKKCSTCHSADKPKALKKTPQEWQATVMRMKNVRGAPMSNEEAQVITSYLSATYGKDAK